MSAASAYHPRLTTRQLLVSVQSASEAELAFAAGVPWVDLKNPAAGALGKPNLDVSHAFLDVSVRYPNHPISLALGEWDGVDWSQASLLLTRFHVGKIGLAGQRNHVSRLTSQLEQAHFGQLRNKIVLALYADWQRADAPAPEQVLELAAAVEAPYLLIDTFCKDGRGLFHWFSVSELNALRLEAQSFGAQLVIAGSLHADDWPKLEQLDDVIVGVRGAVCQQSTDRTSGLSSERIAQWLSWTQR